MGLQTVAGILARLLDSLRMSYDCTRFTIGGGGALFLALCLSEAAAIAHKLKERGCVDLILDVLSCFQ